MANLSSIQQHIQQLKTELDFNQGLHILRKIYVGSDENFIENTAAFLRRIAEPRLLAVYFVKFSMVTCLRTSQKTILSYEKMNNSRRQWRATVVGCPAAP
jgi:hypothetical protein